MQRKFTQTFVARPAHCNLQLMTYRYLRHPGVSDRLSPSQTRLLRVELTTIRPRRDTIYRRCTQEHGKIARTPTIRSLRCDLPEFGHTVDILSERTYVCLHMLHFNNITVFSNHGCGRVAAAQERRHCHRGHVVPFVWGRVDAR